MKEKTSVTAPEALPDSRITKFIESRHIMTIATVDAEGAPYCATVFYAYMKDENLLVFSSDSATHHYQHMIVDSRVAATIALDTRVVGKIQGVQITGRVELPLDDCLSRAKNSYLKKFPYAALSDLTLWILRPLSIKFTDNRLGFGKKLLWHA